MNRNLLVFSLLLIFLGFGFGLYLLSFFGLVLLIPSLLSPSRPPARPVPAPTPQEQRPRRIAPPPVQQPSVAPEPQPMPEAAKPMSPPMQPAYAPATYSGALFPTPILPALSRMDTMAMPTKEAAQKKSDDRDELVEVGAVLALLRLALG